MIAKVVVCCVVLVSLVVGQNITLEWTPCPLSRSGQSQFQAECLSFPTHGDYITSEGEINIAVKRLPSSTTNQLWLVADGPGISGVMFESIAQNFFNDLNQQYSVYIMDHRGTGESTPLNCRNSDPEGLCLIDLQQDFDENVYYYTSYNIAQDYLVLQEFLPQPDKVLYYGLGYGSYLINQILDLSENSPSAVVMDAYRYPSLVDYDSNAHEIGLEFVSECSDVDDCKSKLQKRSPSDLFEQIFVEFEDLDCPIALNVTDRDVRTAFRNMLNDQQLRNLLIPVAVRFLRCNSDDLTYLSTGFPGLVGEFFMTDDPEISEGFSSPTRNTVNINEFFLTENGIQPITSVLTANSDRFYFSNYDASFVSVADSVWAWKYNPEISPFSFARSNVPMLLMAGEFDSINYPQYVAFAGEVFRGKTQRAVQFPYSPHGVLFHSPTTTGTNCGYEVVIQFFNQGNFSAREISFDCVENLIAPDYAAVEASTTSLSSSLFGNPDPWGSGELPPRLQSGSLPFNFDFDSTVELEYTSDELPDIPKLPMSRIVVFDTYDTSNYRGTTNTLSLISSEFYPYHEYAGWASPEGGFVVVGSSSVVSPNTLMLVFLSCIYLLGFFAW